MSNDHPIPQVIVVGILRVLLTTCPNNNAQKPGNGGGIDLHCEWTSCIELLNFQRELLAAHDKYGPILSQLANNENFKSQYMEQRKEESDAENDRHRLIVALSISDFFLFLLRHFKTNHIVQFMYLSQLIVDANGVLVLLKFLN